MKKIATKKNGKKHSYESEYFDSDYFKTHVGEFTEKSDKQLSNWFRGSFEFVNRYVPIKNSKGKSILEFGCAYGSASIVLHNFGLNVLATDISALAVKRAKLLHPEITFTTHDMQKLFKTDKKFDYVLSMDVIEHLEKPELAIKHVYTVLKKNGWAIVSTPNNFPYKKQDPTHISVKDPEEWKSIFEKVGFSNVIVQPATYVPPLLYRYHWRFNITLPIAVFSHVVLSTVFIFAQKK